MLEARILLPHKQHVNAFRNCSLLMANGVFAKDCGGWHILDTLLLLSGYLMFTSDLRLKWLVANCLFVFRSLIVRMIYVITWTV